MSEQKAKRELLKHKVVDLVKEFIKSEGDLTHGDLIKLFGGPPFSEVGAALANLNMSFS